MSGRRGIEPLLDAQRAALARAQAQALEQRVRVGQDLHRAAGQQGQLIVRAHRCVGHALSSPFVGTRPRILEGSSGGGNPRPARARPRRAGPARPAALQGGAKRSRLRARCRPTRRLASMEHAAVRAASRFPWRLFFSIVVVAVFGAAGATFGVVQWLRRDLPSPEQVTAVQTPVKTTVYDVRGRVLHEFYKENRSPVPCGGSRATWSTPRWPPRTGASTATGAWTCGASRAPRSTTRCTCTPCRAAAPSPSSSPATCS